MADERDLDEARITSRVDSFMESLGLKQLCSKSLRSGQVTNAGINIGAKAIDVVLVKDGQILSQHMVLDAHWTPLS